MIFSELSLETKIELSFKLAVLDALERGVSNLIDYTNTEEFDKHVKQYLKLMNNE